MRRKRRLPAFLPGANLELAPSFPPAEYCVVVFKGPIPDPDRIVGCSTDPSTLAVCLQAVLRDKADERRRLGAAQHYAEGLRDQEKAYNAYRPPENWQQA